MYLQIIQNKKVYMQQHSSLPGGSINNTCFNRKPLKIIRNRRKKENLKIKLKSEQYRHKQKLMITVGSPGFKAHTYPYVVSVAQGFKISNEDGTVVTTIVKLEYCDR